MIKGKAEFCGNAFKRFGVFGYLRQQVEVGVGNKPSPGGGKIVGLGKDSLVMTQENLGDIK
jgi:hypothetical protein